MKLPASRGVLVVLNVGTADDTWLREMVRGTPEAHRQLPPSCQRVIVETYAEADRVLARMSTLKYAKHKRRTRRSIAGESDLRMVETPRSTSRKPKRETLMHGVVRQGERIDFNPDCVDCRRERRQRLRQQRLGIHPGTWWALLRGPAKLPVLFARQRDAEQNRDPDEYVVRVFVKAFQRKRVSR